MSATPPPTDYEVYLRTPELLALQKPEATRSCHDELQFQIVHQVAELWMKLVDHEMGLVMSALDQDRPTQAMRTLTRVHHIQQLLIDGVQVLYTMTPRDYMRIRAGLGRGSGQESPGFRRMLALGAVVWPHYEALLARRGTTLLGVYEAPQTHSDLLGVAEALIDFDLRLQEWRNRHILLVYRTIGGATPSLKGKHSELLERGLRTQFFPALWEVREAIYGAWTANHPHGAESSLYKGETP